MELSTDTRIVRLVTTNPKRRESKCRKRFSAYRTGMTVSEYAKKARVPLGQAFRDIRYDTAKGFIALEPDDSSSNQ